ncbi:MAG: rhomboid family intramembrane serine protease [Planctomycetes bacterium]|nr:rhomboid family intramembrane serine protease [Planctomycetota bacterium]
MSWRDRDYARRPAAYPGGSGGVAAIGGRSVVTTLIVVNVGVYVVAALSPRLGEIIYSLGAMQGRSVMRGQVWRLLTAQYLHHGTTHLLLNMIGLHFLGRPLERMWSVRRFLAIYTLAGLCGNVFFTILASRGVINPLLPAVGASGCIYGLLGVVAIRFPAATVYVYFLFPLRIRTAAIVFGAIALLTIIERGENYGGEACHLAGLVFGAWWAMRGEAWWAGTQWRVPGRRRVVRVAPNTGGFARRMEEIRADEETVDRILKKVYEGGIHSLSEAEKRALKEATERQRQREAELGRTDRL